ncbi:MAG: aryl-sulfate sulfotransferase [Myxococcota bacterium]
MRMSVAKVCLALGLACLAIGCDGDADGTETQADVSETQPDAGDSEVSAPDGAAEDAGGDGPETAAEPDVALTGLEFDGLTIGPHPTNTLACVVRWTTARPAHSFVEGGLGEAPEWRTWRSEPRTDHEVTVMGLRESKNYSVRAVAETEGGERVISKRLRCATGTLPEEAPRAEIVVSSPDPERGWTLVPWAVFEGGNPRRSSMVMYDGEGEPVWYWLNNDGATLIVKSLTEGHGFLVGRVNGMLINGGIQLQPDHSVTWTTPGEDAVYDSATSFAPQDGAMHHDLSPLAGGAFSTIRFDVRDVMVDDKLQGVQGDILEIFDAGGALRWSWNSFDEGPAPTDRGDWLHGNALVVNEAERAVYYNASRLRQLWKIDQVTGRVEWRLGDGGDFAPDKTADVAWFEHSHAPVQTGPNRWLVLDNGSPKRGNSRVVEYELNTTTMESRVIWVYPPPTKIDVWWTGAMGSATRLDSGNTFISGMLGLPPAKSRAFEVKPDGEIVWEIGIPLGMMAHSRRVTPWLEPIPASESVAPFEPAAD